MEPIIETRTPRGRHRALTARERENNRRTQLVRELLAQTARVVWEQWSARE